LAVRDESFFKFFNENRFLDCILPHIKSSAGNQLMIIRCLTNMMVHRSGRIQVITILPELIDDINDIKSGSNNLQIAIASFFLNVTIMQTSKAQEKICHLVTEGVIELMKWALDLEALYRCMQALGNLTTTPFGQKTSAAVISVDFVMDKIREVTSTPQTGNLAKLNTIGKQLIASF